MILSMRFIFPPAENIGAQDKLSVGLVVPEIASPSFETHVHGRRLAIFHHLSTALHAVKYFNILGNFHNRAQSSGLAPL